MALFGIGASHQKSASQSTSLDLGLNQSSSVSGSEASSQSTSQGTSWQDALAQEVAKSGGQSSSTQSVFNADQLQQLYKGAIGAAGNVDTSLFQGQTAALFNGGASILDQLGVGAGQDYLSSRLTDNTSRDTQLDALQARMGDLWSNSINPSITASAVGGGQLGGGRQGVAQAQGAKNVADQFQQGAASIISSDQAAKDSAAAQLIAGQNQSAGVALSAIPGLANVAQAGLGAPLSPYTALAGILGPATTLTNATSSNFGESSSTSQSQGGSQQTAQATSEQIAQAISEALGIQYGTSQSTSNAHADSFNFGMG